MDTKNRNPEINLERKQRQFDRLTAQRMLIRQYRSCQHRSTWALDSMFPKAFLAPAIRDFNNMQVQIAKKSVQICHT